MCYVLALAVGSEAVDQKPNILIIPTEDPIAQNNLASNDPEMVRQLRARLDAYRAAAVPPRAEDEPAKRKPPRVWGQ